MGTRRGQVCYKRLVMTSADTLERWGQTHITNKWFLGVFPADWLLPSDEVIMYALEAPAVLICNYDPASMPGSHWVAVSVQPSSISWFD